MTRKMNLSLGGALIFLTAFFGNCRAEDVAAWELAGKGFRSRDFEVKMLENGIVEIYGAGQFLASSGIYDLGWRNINVSNPKYSVDETNKTIVLTMLFQHEGGSGNCVREMKLVNGGIELATSFPVDFGVLVIMTGIDYDGGRWQSGIGNGGAMVARTVLMGRDGGMVFKFGATGEGLTEAVGHGKLSFWRKDSELGFSVENVQKNTMTLYDVGSAGKDGNPRAYYYIWMNARKAGDTWPRIPKVCTLRAKSGSN